MALRVLLADESTTIKKVIQLALQDYAVQVRSVNVGTDALEVARSFQPDLILADVLLPKKTGYDVSQDIKSDPQLKDTPIILIWSGFMELDETLFINSGADDKLEKPFNVETLRALVQKWVPKTQEQKISEHLHFPTTITEFEAEPKRLKEQILEPTEVLEHMRSFADSQNLEEIDIDDTPTGEWDMDSFEDINSFVPTDHLIQKSVGAPGLTEGPAGLSVAPPLPPEQPLVSSANINVFKLDNFSPEEEEEEAVPFDLQALNQTPVNVQDILAQQQALKAAATAKQQSPPVTTTSAETSTTPDADLPPIPRVPELSQTQIEELLRAQSREVIEAVVWKIVPEMAGQIIRKELERLMAEE